VAVRCEAGWLLGSWVRIPLKAWMFVRVFLCCVVLCRYRPCDGLITRPRSPAICLNSSRNLLYVRRPRSFKDYRARGKKTYLKQVSSSKYEVRRGSDPPLSTQNCFVSSVSPENYKPSRGLIKTTFNHCFV
jgi:hypothetical protein